MEKADGGFNEYDKNLKGFCMSKIMFEILQVSNTNIREGAKLLFYVKKIFVL